jgi:hypothetical protein
VDNQFKKGDIVRFFLPYNRKHPLEKFFGALIYEDFEVLEIQGDKHVSVWTYRKSDHESGIKKLTVCSSRVYLVKRPSVEKDEYVVSAEGFRTNPKNWKSGLSLV